ncbi:hypothetical protein VFPPC_16537 [Pochonia chlamydosporia 170]|uniref:Uncharacterized protein n=1 Tax=Pochonia chlamydosporia 170 TaxID=1380566 RepID=A0A179F949_METCM|nr:hypothetical protein VFPPC_16537 [Pochonia chlamydosporia 170]OAQ61639.1 hypothetical protein VFPPC_16537 [Pochonia chlamydosporia 170]
MRWQPKHNPVLPATRSMAGVYTATWADVLFKSKFGGSHHLPTCCNERHQKRPACEESPNYCSFATTHTSVYMICNKYFAMRLSCYCPVLTATNRKRRPPSKAGAVMLWGIGESRCGLSRLKSRPRQQGDSNCWQAVIRQAAQP